MAHQLAGPSLFIAPFHSGKFHQISQPPFGVGQIARIANALGAIEVKLKLPAVQSIAKAQARTGRLCNQLHSREEEYARLSLSTVL